MIIIRSRYGEKLRAVPTLGTYGEWCVHRSKNAIFPYNVSHKPTGLNTEQFNTLAEARTLAKHLAATCTSAPTQSKWRTWKSYFNGPLEFWSYDQVIPAIKVYKEQIA